MKFCIFSLCILVICSCSHSYMLGGDVEEIQFIHVPNSKSAPMQLNVYESKSNLCLCSISLINCDGSWKLCYIEFNGSTISHHMHASVNELEVERVMRDADIIFDKQPATIFYDEEIYGDKPSIHVTISSDSSGTSYRVSRAWYYPVDIEEWPEWLSFLDYLKRKFPPFKSLLNNLEEEVSPADLGGDRVRSE